MFSIVMEVNNLFADIINIIRELFTFSNILKKNGASYRRWDGLKGT